MRSLKIQPKPSLISVAVDHNLGILTSIEELSSHDLIYIYHHMQVGCKLNILPPQNNQERVPVYFKNFFIGYLPEAVSQIATRLLHRGIPVDITVKRTQKEKYLPFSGLDVEIRALVQQ